MDKFRKQYFLYTVLVLLPDSSRRDGFGNSRHMLGLIAVSSLVDTVIPLINRSLKHVFWPIVHVCIHKLKHFRRNTKYNKEDIVIFKNKIQQQTKFNST